MDQKDCWTVQIEQCMIELESGFNCVSSKIRKMIDYGLNLCVIDALNFAVVGDPVS